MDGQVIISISREFGSAGHEIADMLASKLGLPLYDRNLLQEIAEEKGISTSDMEKYDEKPRNPFLARKVGEHTNYMEEHIANMQFDYLREKAESGESFVVVGRCADAVLKEYRGLVTVFITGDEKEKIMHVMNKYDISELAAKEKINRHDKKRKLYHSNHSDTTWGDVHTYDLCVNSTKLGLEKSVDVIINYVKTRFN